MPAGDKNDLPKPIRDAYYRGYQDGLAVAGGGVTGPEGAGARCIDTVSALHQLIDRPLRYIRFTSEEGGKIVHCAAGVSTPEYPSHYVYYRGESWETCHDYVPGLLGKVEKFEAGALKPSPERRR